MWLFCAAATLLYAPLAITLAVINHQSLGGVQIAFMVGSTLMHLAYFLSLQTGYRVGDLSLVYPLARGTGPLLSTLAAIVLFKEHPTPLALAGAITIVAGVFLMTFGRRAPGNEVRTRLAVGYGLLTGVIIAVYTLWDKHAVSVLAIPPILYNWGNDVGRTILLAPVALRNWEKVKMEWQKNRFEILGIALLSPLSYILVLTALKFTPVSYVAPAREVSILVGAILGVKFLAEGDVKRRLIAASGMVLGVVFLALG